MYHKIHRIQPKNRCHRQISLINQLVLVNRMVVHQRPFQMPEINSYKRKRQPTTNHFQVDGKSGLISLVDVIMWIITHVAREYFWFVSDIENHWKLAWSSRLKILIKNYRQLIGFIIIDCLDTGKSHRHCRRVGKCGEINAVAFITWVSINIKWKFDCIFFSLIHLFNQFTLILHCTCFRSQYTYNIVATTEQWTFDALCHLAKPAIACGVTGKSTVLVSNITASCWYWCYSYRWRWWPGPIARRWASYYSFHCYTNAL